MMNKGDRFFVVGWVAFIAAMIELKSKDYVFGCIYFALMIVIRRMGAHEDARDK